MPREATETYDDTLLFIRQFIKQHGYSPSVREIAAGIGTTSTSVAGYHIRRLSDLGKIEWTPGIARSIRIIKGKRNDQTQRRQKAAAEGH